MWRRPQPLHSFLTLFETISRQLTKLVLPNCNSMLTRKCHLHPMLEEHSIGVQVPNCIYCYSVFVTPMVWPSHVHHGDLFSAYCRARLLINSELQKKIVRNYSGIFGRIHNS